MSSQATESTRLIDFLAWVEVNKKKLLIGTAAVAIAIAAYSIYQWQHNEAETAASEALYKLQAPATAAEKTPDAQAFLQVAATHSGTRAGALALLLGAEGLFRENKFAEAKTQFEKFLATYSDHPVAPTAAFGIAAALDALDKTNEALAAYQDVVTRYAGSVVASQAKLGLARLYQAKGDLAQAVKIYDELARPPASSVWSSEAYGRREQLVAQHPELAKTNPPALVLPSVLTNAPPTNPPPVDATATNPAPAKRPGLSDP